LPEARGEEGWKVLFPPRPFKSPGKNATAAPGAAFSGDANSSGGADDFGSEMLSVRFTVLSRFNRLKAPEYRNERNYFNMKGKEVPFVPFAPESGAALSFERLTPGHRGYFLFWRGELRRGKFPETDFGYITLYARELILFADSGNPMGSFRELQKLWHGYRADFPVLDRLFPVWLMDFGVLYNRAGEALAELLPFAPESGLSLLINEYIHRKYIENRSAPGSRAEDGRAAYPLSLEDVFTLLRSRRTPRLPGLELKAASEKAFRGIDRFLRKQYGKGLVAFFYPSRSRSGEVRAFEGLSGLGESSYRYECIDFCRHKVFIDFLESSLAYIAYGLNRERGIARGREPPIDGLWKFLIHRVLGFTAVVTPPPELRLKTVHLESEILDQLRLESESLRELLSPLDGDTYPPEAGDMDAVPKTGLPAGFWPRGFCNAKAPPKALEPAASMPPLQALPPPRSGEALSLAAFVEGLDENGREALRLIASGPDDSPAACMSGFAAWAGKNKLLPELLIDRLNEAFREFSGDLLVEIRDGGVSIQEEYRAALRRVFLPGNSAN
jgi:hypothetical protein